MEIDNFSMAMVEVRSRMSSVCYFVDLARAPGKQNDSTRSLGSCVIIQQSRNSEASISFYGDCSLRPPQIETRASSMPQRLGSGP